MTLEQWLQRRSPEVPEAFLPYLLGDAGDGVAVESHLRRALETLDRALLEHSEVREAAFPLLAADAWLTYACEEAAEGEDFPSACLDIIAAVGKRFAP